ncbi:MAG TPA: hypothetical protein DEP82_04535, partial [Arthrobacter bacterium]|nr:hypothetical protein [Arthrobacter sp.]
LVSLPLVSLESGVVMMLTIIAQISGKRRRVSHGAAFHVEGAGSADVVFRTERELGEVLRPAF